MKEISSALKKIKLGFCPIGKFVFSHEDALKYKKLIEKKLKQWDIDYLGIDGVVKDGIVRSVEDVEPVVRHFRANSIDGLFMPHCNFGTEHAVGLIGRNICVPVLLWGPRDEAPLPDGTRLRDTLCGLFASSKILFKLGVQLTYIENCRINELAFEAGVKNFVRVMSVVKSFRGMRIGQIGSRIDFFWSTIINESELLERFGIEILPIDIIEVIKNTKRRAEKNFNRYMKELRELSRAVKIVGYRNNLSVINNFALRDEMLELANRYNLSAFAFQSFMSVCDELGTMVELAHAQVSEAGYPVATETDIHGAISQVLLQSASVNTQPAFLADFTIRHPNNDNGVLLWHCNFPLALAKKRTNAALGPHWILPGIAPGSCHWLLRNGDITLTRFDGDRGEYCLAFGSGKTIPGPRTQNTYVWIEVDDWRTWERQLIEGPFIHHVGAIYGQYAPILSEAAKYLPGIKPVPLGKNPGKIQDAFFSTLPLE